MEVHFFNANKKRFFNFFMICAGVGVIAYIVLTANELTNTYDGLWGGSYHSNYRWDISLGRWFWYFIGRGVRNMYPAPFTTVLAILISTLGGCITAFRFGVNDSWKGYFLVLLSVINTAVCVSLTYRHQSLAFLLGYLFSVIGIVVISDKQNAVRAGLSVIFLTLSLSSYQAEIGCACLLIILVLVLLLQNEDDPKKIIRFFVCAAIVLILSFLLYKILWEVTLKINHLKIPDYRNADQITFVTILKSLPYTFQNTYKTFTDYFFTNRIHKYVYQDSLVYKAVILFVFLSFFAVGGVRAAQKGIRRLLLYIACILLIPPAAAVSMILANDLGSPWLQMCLPHAVIIPYLICITDTGGLNKFVRRTMETAWFLTLSFILLGNFLTVSVDQHVMLSGRNNTEEIMTQAISDIDFSAEQSGGYVFIGAPAYNDLFFRDPLWEQANDYAKYGKVWYSDHVNVLSYQALLRDTGINLHLNSDHNYWHELEKREEIKTMPVFPNEGYIRNIDNVTVIKFSEY